MKKLAFGALVAGLLAVVACGGSKNNNNTPDAVVIVTQPDAAATTCNPIAQTGCQTTEKCTWIRVAASASSQIGQLGCVPNGDKLLNGTCTWGAAGATTGYDDCQKGMICKGSSRTDKAPGTCVGICDSSAAAGATGACATNYGCERYSHYFENTGDPATTTGLCDPTCDPLSQTRDYDKATTGAHCGGALDANQQPTMECNGFPSSTAAPSQFTCSSVLDPTKKGDSFAYDATLGGVFANSCAAGYIPLYWDNTVDAAAQDDMKVICMAYCQPAPTSKETATQPGGVAPYTCAAAGTGGTHQCRYWWTFEDATTMVSNYTNGLGYCWNYANYTYDGSMLHPATSATTPWPDCTKLSSTLSTIDATAAGGMQTDPDNIFFGCGKEPGTFTGGVRPPYMKSPVRPLLSPVKSAD